MLECKIRPQAKTISIVADSEARTLRAADALRPVDADAASAGDLPTPTLDAEPGLARCMDR
jgi:hypothetical protein